MTREDVVNSYGYKVAKASVDYSQKYAKDDELQGIVMDTFEDAAKFGYGLAVDKACEWLRNNWYKYINIDADGVVCFGHWENDFRKAMKGE